MALNPFFSPYNQSKDEFSHNNKTVTINWIYFDFKKFVNPCMDYNVLNQIIQSIAKYNQKIIIKTLIFIVHISGGFLNDRY